jgi:hypothetical protein
MTFFDKKTEVISIELTQYGKHLLSKGKFKPVYYEFYDNDVLYDSEYCGITEERNNAQERIKNETPYLKPQYNISGVETQFKDLLESKRDSTEQKESFQQTLEKTIFPSSPLGTSRLDDTYPAFNITSHTTQIKTSTEKKLNAGISMNIPELTLETTSYKTNILDQVNQPVPDELLAQSLPFAIEDAPRQQTFKVFQDGTYISVESESIIIEFNEANSKDIGKNFDIEIFEITSSTKTNQDIYMPLYFIDGNIQINNENLIIDTGDEKRIFSIEDKKLVEYYLTINEDDKIEKEKLDMLSKNVSSPRVYQENKTSN